MRFLQLLLFLACVTMWSLFFHDNPAAGDLSKSTLAVSAAGGVTALAIWNFFGFLRYILRLGRAQRAIEESAKWRPPADR